jgi:hypothetical protein
MRITKGNFYTSRNGMIWEVLTTERNDPKFPIVAMNENGDIIKLTSKGEELEGKINQCDFIYESGGRVFSEEFEDINSALLKHGYSNIVVESDFAGIDFATKKHITIRAKKMLPPRDYNIRTPKGH